MKNTLRVMAVAALFAAVPASAQGGMGGGGMGGGMRGNPEQMMARQKEMLFKDITLSAEQTTKVDSIMTAGMGKQREMMQAAMAGGDRAGMREQMQKMNEERNTAIKAVLTDDQKKKFDENLAAMPQGRRGGA